MAKRNRHKKVSALPALIENIQADSELKSRQVVINPPGEVKMSEVIAELIQPFREEASSLPEYHWLVTLSCVAWNTANLPAEKRMGAINSFLDEFSAMPARDRQEITQIALDLVRRKVALFPDNRRMIVDFKVTETKNDYHVAVASTQQPE